MNTNPKRLTPVVGAAYEVSNVGAGFLEKIYERGLMDELRLRGLAVEAQVRCPVSYKGVFHQPAIHSKTQAG
jgi:GxxExxY protein